MPSEKEVIEIDDDQSPFEEEEDKEDEIDSDGSSEKGGKDPSFGKKEKKKRAAPKPIMDENGLLKRRTRKHVSCQNCRTRKMRCSRTSPCSSCVARQEKCIWEGAKPKFSVDETDELAVAKSENARLRRLVDLLMKKCAAFGVLPDDQELVGLPVRSSQDYEYYARAHEEQRQAARAYYPSPHSQPSPPVNPSAYRPPYGHQGSHQSSHPQSYHHQHSHAPPPVQPYSPSQPSPLGRSQPELQFPEFSSPQMNYSM